MVVAGVVADDFRTDRSDVDGGSTGGVDVDSLCMLTGETEGVDMGGGEVEGLVATAVDGGGTGGVDVDVDSLCMLTGETEGVDMGGGVDMRAGEACFLDA